MENNNVTPRTHRVGAVTSGLCMVAFGILLLLHTLFGLLDYGLILSFWPVVLISLGIELLLSTLAKSRLVYDKAAIVLLFIMTLFVLTLAAVDVCMEMSELYWKLT